MKGARSVHFQIVALKARLNKNPFFVRVFLDIFNTLITTPCFCPSFQAEQFLLPNCLVSFSVFQENNPKTLRLCKRASHFKNYVQERKHTST